jgi:hypothetical protein
MNRRRFVVSALACVKELSAPSASFGQSGATQPDLAQFAVGKRLRCFNRSAAALTDAGRTGARLSEAPGDGVAYLEGIEFTAGTIELELRGKDAQQQSFLGIAFHGVDGATYDAVYFRPFNFRAEDPERRKRAVQYISHPSYRWEKLRAEHPGKYEQAVTPVPDPNGWFHVRIVVASPQVSVFVEGANEPSMIVSQLSARGKGLIGLWAGNYSGGDFANLKLIPA